MGIIALIACAGALLWLGRRIGLPRREAVLVAAVLWGTLLALITETLSLFHAITPGWLIGCWLAATAAALVAAGMLRTAKRNSSHASVSISRRGTIEAWMLGTAAVLVLLLGIIGTISPPSNTDSMTYHLPRVMHWMQNRSVAHYATVHPPQLYQPPWAEFAILQLQVLTGSDRLAFAVQWMSLIVCAVGAALLARKIGAGPRGQVMAVLFLVTVPGVVLQAYSTQNNLSVAMWLICVVAAILSFARPPRPVPIFAIALASGASAGLAMLTKGTAYLFVLPLAAWFAVVVIRAGGGRGVAAIALAALVAAAINCGHWSRNWRSYDSILTPADDAFLYRARVSAPALLASNVIRNAALNLRTGIRELDAPVDRAVAIAHKAIGVDPSDRAITFPGHSLENVTGIGEDVSGSPLHLLLLLASGAAVLVGAVRGRWPLATVLVGVVAVGFVLFCFAVKWQMFHARLQVPLFILAAPFVGLALERVANRRLTNVAMVAALAMAFALVVVNPGHPLIGRRSILHQPREAQYFANRPERYEPYRNAVDLLAASGCTYIGITTGPVWEYPLWVMLHDRTGKWPRIVPVNSGADAIRLQAVLALPAGPSSQSALPAGIQGKMIPLGGGATIVMKSPTPAAAAGASVR